VRHADSVMTRVAADLLVGQPLAGGCVIITKNGIVADHIAGTTQPMITAGPRGRRCRQPARAMPELPTDAPPTPVTPNRPSGEMEVSDLVRQVPAQGHGENDLDHRMPGCTGSETIG
jgi:hypothetical protein